MSYGLILGHTRSGEPGRVAYGFAMVFVIGFLWGFPGGAGTALAARSQLGELMAPLLAAFGAWAFLDYGWVRVWGEPPNWCDSDWLGASLALEAALLVRFWRGSSFGVRLILWLGGGWWAGFLLFPVALGIRMTAPRGDNRAGMAGSARRSFLGPGARDSRNCRAAVCGWACGPDAVLPWGRRSSYGGKRPVGGPTGGA